MATIGEEDHQGGGKVVSAAGSATIADVTTDTQVLIWGWAFKNTTAAAAYVQVFDLQSGSVTVGTTAPTFAVGLAANESMAVGFEKPIRFKTGCSFATTTTRTGNSSAVVDVNFIITSNP